MDRHGLTDGEDVSATIVMPVFNALPYLNSAIESIVAQTYSDFRFVIYDDHSDDGSYETALRWAARDRRISVTRGAHRLGPAGSSNAAAALAQSPIVARMDADDVAAPRRLARQVNSLIEHPEAAMVGSTYEIIDRHGTVIRGAQPALIAGPSPPFVHSSICYRRAAFIAAGGYRTGTDYFEDYDLYRRMARHGSLLIVNEPLIRVRLAGQNARLQDDRDYVLAQLSGLAGGNAASRRIAPSAFRALTSLSVQAQRRPRLMGSLLRSGDWSDFRGTLIVACFVALAEASPRSALHLSRHWSRLKQKWAATRFTEGASYTWRDRDDTALPS